MARVKRGVTAHARHKKVLKLAKGYVGRSSTAYRPALERVEKALQYAYRDRRNKKRDFRGLWIQRINAAVREHGVAAYARKQVPKAFREDAREQDVEAAVEQARDWPGETVVRTLEAVRERPDRTPLLLEHSELPVLLVQGDDDPAIGALDPQERHVTRIVTDTAHMGVLTDPHTFAGIVHGWVADEIDRQN